MTCTHVGCANYKLKMNMTRHRALTVPFWGSSGAMHHQSKHTRAHHRLVGSCFAVESWSWWVLQGLQSEAREGRYGNPIADTGFYFH
jgi:hypothetical protein